jgi:hypothetical protein
MKTLKMSLANMQGKMNRREMKLIMAGGSGNCGIWCPGANVRVAIPDCSRASATETCGGNPTGATCTC